MLTWAKIRKNLIGWFGINWLISWNIFHVFFIRSHIGCCLAEQRNIWTHKMIPNEPWKRELALIRNDYLILRRFMARLEPNIFHHLFTGFRLPNDLMRINMSLKWLLLCLEPWAFTKMLCNTYCTQKNYGQNTLCILNFTWISQSFSNSFLPHFCGHLILVPFIFHRWKVLLLC